MRKRLRLCLPRRLFKSCGKLHSRRKAMIGTQGQPSHNHLLDGGRRNGFDAAQLAWVSYRDANCSFYNDPEGGTIARLDANTCMLDMTARRVMELRDIRSRVER